jgi:hypothetical protein
MQRTNQQPPPPEGNPKREDPLEPVPIDDPGRSDPEPERGPPDEVVAKLFASIPISIDEP